MLQKNNGITNTLLTGLFLLIPFSAFMLRKVDIWHAHGYFFQASLLIIFCVWLFDKNRPFACFVAWSGLLTLWHVIDVQVNTGNYASMLIFPYFNLMLMVVLYLFLTQVSGRVTNVSGKDIYRKILRWYPYVIIVILLYSLLQSVHLDQFYHRLDIGDQRDELVGTIGNPMHLSHYLVITLPLLFKKKFWLIVSLFVIVLTQSASGFICAGIVIVFYYIFKLPNKRRIFNVCLVTGLIVLSGFILYKYTDLHGLIFNFLRESGRVDKWEKWYRFFHERPITGWCFGIINSLSRQPEFFQWRHCHNELYQVAIETGLIGSGLVIWGLIDNFKKFIKAPRNDLALTYQAMFVGFVTTSMFGFPAHLWLLSSLGILSYSYVYSEDCNDSNQERDTGSCQDSLP